MSKTEMDELFKSGKKLYSPLIKLVYLPAAEKEIIISAPIRTFKRAVDRNRIKRLIRESIRKMEIGKYHLAIIYIGTKVESFENIKAELEKIIPRIK